MILHDVYSAMVELRAEAESLMTLTATVTRATGESVLDEATGAEREVSTTVYEGVADLVMPGALPRESDAAGQPVASLMPVLKLPIAAPRLRSHDLVALDDGRRFVVVRDVTRAHPVTARYVVEG